MLIAPTECQFQMKELPAWLREALGMAPVYVGASGVWKELDLSIGVSGSFKNVTGGWIGVSGSWKRCYQRVTIPANLVGLFTASPGTGWDILNGVAASPNLHGHFLKGGSSQGSSTGSNTHGHGSYSGNTGYATRATPPGGFPNNDLMLYDHAHSIAHTHAAGDHRPGFYGLLPYVVNGAATLPTSFVGFCDGTVFTGWAAVTALYDYFISCNTSAAGGAGGSATHDHAWTGEALANRKGSPYQSGSGGSCPYSYHTHTFNHEHVYTNLPPYIDLIPVSPTAATSVIPAGLICFFLGSTVPTGWSVYSIASGKFIRCKSTVDTTGGGAATHTHSWTGNTGAWGSQAGGTTTAGATARYSHVHSGNHSHTTAGAMEPQHFPLLICKKD